MDFNKNKILFIGFGAVARSTLPMLVKHINIPIRNIAIIDSRNKENELGHWIEKGITFYQVEITPDNLDQVLSGTVHKGDLIIDLSLNIDCGEILAWCHSHEVLYINASVEVWDPYSHEESEFPYEKTLHYRHTRLADQTRKWSNSTTCIVDHGANPGLVSHFARKGLVDITSRMISDGITTNPVHLQNLINEKRFAELAMEIGITVIHCSEKDTQIAGHEKQNNEFVNTWSIEGFYEEAIAPAEIGWGTHETNFPVHSYQPPDGPGNELILKKMGLNTWIKSWVPDQEITGMVIRHGEAFGLSDRWTVHREGKSVYRPTVCYVYRPCPEAMKSLGELRNNNYKMPESQRILDAGDINSGEDILGVLLMGHPYHSWWTGSILSIDEAEIIEPGQNATTIQVGIGLVAAVMWMIENPNKGFCLPDDLPYEYILSIAIPYLGKFCSFPSGWRPSGSAVIPEKDNEKESDDIPTWQFNSFISDDTKKYP